jgi:hypothetical protein
MGALPQALDIIFEVHWKRSNEKKKNLQNILFFFSLDPHTAKAYNFLISCLF